MILPPQAIGTDASYLITLVGPDGLTPMTSLLGSEALTAHVWAGGGLGLLATEAVAFVDHVAATASFRVSAADTRAIGPAGVYTARVTILDSLGHTTEGWRGSICLIDSPGDTPPPATYCGYQDMIEIATWIGRLQNLAGDLAGFAGQRAQARQWIVEQILSRRRVWLDRYLDVHGFAGRLNGYPSTDYGGLYGYGGEWGDDDPIGYPTWIDAQIEGLRGTLAAGTLAVPTLLIDDRIRRVAALWATSIVCEQQLGPGPGADGFGVLAATYRDRAIRDLGPVVFRVDQNADGLADLVIG